LPLEPDDLFNRRLVANVRPPGWVNPVPVGRYNLVVIGAGAAGLVAAAGAAGLGARVALVERHLLGGDCLNVGCVPSKALLAGARRAALLRAAQPGADGSASSAGCFAHAMQRVRQTRSQISPHDSATRFRELGVDIYFGNATFLGPDSVRVGDAVLAFRKAVIAAGGRPARPGVSGLEDGGYLTNETVFNLAELPARLAIIGAGPIGCEMAQAFARLGSQVWLFEAMPRVLPREHARASQIMAEALSRDGVRIACNARDVCVISEGAQKRLRARGSPEAHDALVDQILIGAGRVPNVEGLGLEAAGVAYDQQGVQVNDFLQTTNRRIYAAGDVCSRYKFTHAADAMARIVIQNALFFRWARASALVIPWCTYTDPEVARVGLDEQEAHARGLNVTPILQPLAEVDRALIEGDSDGFVEVLVKRGTDRIVGATIVAPHAGELICELSLAMTARLGLKAIARTIHPYPTRAEALKKAADAWQRTRLTPRVKSLLRRWFAWLR
jgi:pyruvate/2-oxoglutarate dehydrogenase complex dihydrolipoamide dehydrogenase (E3) component